MNLTELCEFWCTMLRKFGTVSQPDMLQEKNSDAIILGSVMWQRVNLI
jgi:hypothetical protein